MGAERVRSPQAVGCSGRCSATAMLVPLRTAVLMLLAALLPSAYVCGQTQLPPGTSSSADDVAQSAPTRRNMDALAQAEDKILAQDWPGAVALLRPILGNDPKHARALYDLGYCLEPLNDEEGAKRAYEQAAAADTTAVEPRVGLGLMLARQGDATGAAKLLHEAVALPNAISAKAAKARAYRALARLDLASAPDKAREDLLAGTRLTDEGSPDLILTGEIAEALHDDASAEQAYARALQINSADAEAQAQYTRVLTREGKFDQAKTTLAAALKEHPQDKDLLSEQAGLLVREKNFTDAIPALQALHTGKPLDLAVTRLLARAYVAAGTPAEANTLFQELLKADAGNGELASEWGDSLIRQKRNAEAEDVLQKALTSQFATREMRAQAASELAFAASANHHPDAVVRAIAIRNEILPMDATSAFLLATAHDTVHHTREAAGYYRQFLELANDKFPDEELQAKQRLQTLSRAK